LNSLRVQGENKSVLKIDRGHDVSIMPVA
jgi:hypothetical protein